MAEFQGKCTDPKSAVRPKKLSLEDVLHAVLDSGSDESDLDLESDFRESSIEEESDSDSGNLDVAQAEFSQGRPTNDDLPMDIDVSSHFFGYLSIL